MSSVEYLREFVNERLTAAAEEIFTVLTKTVVEYEEEIDRQRKLLDIAWKPEIQLHRIELPQQYVCKQEEVLAEQQLCLQERNSSPDQEDPDPPQIKEEQEQLCTSPEGDQLVLKQETESFMLSPIYEESDQSEDETLYLNPDDTLRAAETESVVNIPVKSSVVSEPNSDHELLSHYSPAAESQDQKEGKHGDSGTTGDAEPEPKKQKQYLNPDDTLSAAETESVVNIPVQSSVVSEPNSDHQLLSHCSPAAESQDQKEGKHGDSGSTGDAEPKPKKRHRKTKSHSNNVNKLNLSEIHHNTHTGKKSLKCETCGKDFEFQSALQRHLRSHTGEKPFLCKTCGRRFGRTSELKNHTRIHTGEKPYSCSTCGTTFRRPSELNTHLRIHTGETPYFCKTCGKDFRFDSELKVHMRTHTGEKPHLCKTCGQSFSVMSALKRHMRIHTGEKPYSCKTCGRDFRFGSDLKVHMRTHTGEKPYLCKTCGSDFRCSSALLVHMRRTHTGDKPYHCITCGKRFWRVYDLARHKRVHTGK